MIYLDSAASTALSPIACQAMIKAMTETFGNPSSTHSHGRAAKKLLREARNELAILLHTQAQHLFFTSGGTESNNLAIKGYALSHQHQGKHVITTAIEHHSVLEPIDYLVREHGFHATVLAPKKGEITAQQVKDALRDDTILVSIMYANNETGMLLPIKEIGEILARHPAAFHVDAVQAIGKIPVYPEEIGADFLSASAHKFHGPKGAGFLYARKPFTGLLHGGSQESHHRAGTENLPGIVGMLVALKEEIRTQNETLAHIQQLKNELLVRLKPLHVYLNQGTENLPYIANIGFPHHNNNQLLLQLDLAGISVSAGSACTAGVTQRSHVLSALYGEHSPRVTESIRISFSSDNTLEEIIATARVFHTILGENNGLSTNRST